MSTLGINHCLTARTQHKLAEFYFGEIAEKVYEEVLAQRQLAIRP